jgi:hypothetical protein
MKNVYKIVVGKYKGKRPVGRPWRRWQITNKVHLEEMDSTGSE